MDGRRSSIRSSTKGVSCNFQRTHPSCRVLALLLQSRGHFPVCGWPRGDDIDTLRDASRKSGSSLVGIYFDQEYTQEYGTHPGNKHDKHQHD